ncbi:MAG: DUF169 domain-containing protein [Streptosporangiaceae bacterium]
MTHQAIAERLTRALELDITPIALSFTDTPPEGVSRPDRPVPSACSFWRMAERGVFYAPAEAHHNCLVGTMVMGFPLGQELQQQLGELVNSMCECTYLMADEGDKIPAAKHAAAGILYGPLADLPVPPELVLFWLTPRQAMLYNEAAGAASWARSSIVSNGRPACAALPSALSSGDPVVSWGCMGMRTFTEVPDDRLLAVVPGSRIEEFTGDLDRVVAANQTMREFYQGKKALLDAGASQA